MAEMRSAAFNFNSETPRVRGGLKNIENISKNASTVKRKPLGIVTNQIDKSFKVQQDKSKSVDRPFKGTFHGRENESKKPMPGKLIFNSIGLEKAKVEVVPEEPEYDEIEEIHVPKHTEDNFEDIWPLDEQPKSYISSFINWFPLSVKRGLSDGEEDVKSDVIDYEYPDFEEAEVVKVLPKLSELSFDDSDLIFPD